MNETVRVITGPVGTSAGAMLRAAREKQGLHIAALAAAIKVTPRKLEALENDRLDELPDATFARALAQTVCRSLKIDSRPVLDLLPPAGGSKFKTADGGLNMPFRERPGRAEPGLAGGAVRPLVWAAGVLMIAAAAIYLVPAQLWKGRFGAAAPAAVDAAPPAALPASAASIGTAPASAAASTAVPGDAASSPPLPNAAATASSPAIDVASTPAPAADAPPALVQLSTTQASWVEVREAGNRLLLSRVVQPGESLDLDGQLPIRLTIGNAAVTQLGFRGQPVDLRPSTRDNVARVELK